MLIKILIILPLLVLLLLFITPKYSNKDLQSGGGGGGGLDGVVGGANKIITNYKYLLLLGIIGFSSLVYKLFV